VKIAFLGATKGIGRAFARALAARGDELFLLGRSTAELDGAATDLALRVRPAGAGITAIGQALCDLEQPASFAPALAAAETALGGLDAVVVTAGLFGTQDRLESDGELRRRLLAANFAGTIEFCEAARERLLARGGGRLMVFSSVAGDRGRKSVVLYGAAKAGLSTYLEGLDHRFHERGLKVITVKPGFVRTGMTSGLPEPPFAADPEALVPALLRALDRGAPVAYVPGIWRWVMTAIQMLPRAVMRRAGF
jgi:NAD(P)-dependent dehydrogenase (short-subunit alcohol dehydrogenase family)